MISNKIISQQDPLKFLCVYYIIMKNEYLQLKFVFYFNLFNPFLSFQNKANVIKLLILTYSRKENKLIAKGAFLILWNL